jgi:hypothetical protein
MTRRGSAAVELRPRRLRVQPVQPQQVLAEDLPLGLVGQLRVPVSGAEVLGIEKSMNARSPPGCGSQPAT